MIDGDPLFDYTELVPIRDKLKIQSYVIQICPYDPRELLIQPYNADGSLGTAGVYHNIIFEIASHCEFFMQPAKIFRKKGNENIGEPCLEKYTANQVDNNCVVELAKFTT